MNLSTSRALAAEYLLAQAQELNPVESIWGYLRHHAMRNYCSSDGGGIKYRARRNLRSVQRRSNLVLVF